MQPHRSTLCIAAACLTPALALAQTGQAPPLPGSEIAQFVDPLPALVTTTVRWRNELPHTSASHLNPTAPSPAARPLRQGIHY